MSLRLQFEKYVSIPDEDWNKIEQKYYQKKLSRKEHLIMTGDILQEEYYVQSGCLKVYFIDKKGVERILQFAPERWFCGDFDAFAKKTATILNIQAIEPSEILCIKRSDKEELYHQFPYLERVFRILVQNAIITMQRRILSSMSETADERYCKFIEKYPGLEQRISQQDIASYLGVTPEFLSKAKKKRLKQL